MAQMPGDRRRPTPASTGGIQTQKVGPSRVTTGPNSFWSNTTTLSPLGSRLDVLRQTPAQLRTTITRGGRTYKEIDNGIANVLVPTLDPGTSPADVAANKAAIGRAFFMAQNPLAGGAYGIAAMLGASPEARERAMIGGAVADAGLSVATPRGAHVRRPTPMGKAAPTVPRDGSTRYREANTEGQSRGLNAVLAAPLGAGGETKRKVKPPGFVSGKKPYNHDRAHLQGKQLGGHADQLKKVFASTRNPTNSPDMSGFEGEAARRVRSGEIIDYSVTPLYDPGMAAPRLILMTMSGDRGAPVARLVENPLGRRPK